MATGFDLVGPVRGSLVVGTTAGTLVIRLTNNSTRTGTVSWSNMTATLPTVYSVGGSNALPAAGASSNISLPFTLVGSTEKRTTQLTTFKGTLSAQPDGAIVEASFSVWLYDASDDENSLFQSFSANTGGSALCNISDLRFVTIARGDNNDGGVDITNVGDCPALIRIGASIPTIWYGEILLPGERRCILAQELAGGLNVYAACPQKTFGGSPYIPGFLTGQLVCQRRLDCVPTGTTMSVFPETLT